MIRRLTALALVGFAVVGALPSDAMAEPSSAALSLARCLETRGSLNVIMLLDESESLRLSTDRQDRRVEGAKAALAGLAALTERPAGTRPPRIHILLAGFAGKVTPDPENEQAPPWQRLDGRSIDRLLAQAGEYANRDRGSNTDYATAVLGAKRLLDSRAAAVTSRGGEVPCQAIFWFTDGKYDLRPRTEGGDLPVTLPYAKGIELTDRRGVEAAMRAGRRALCGRGGVLDDLAGQGVVKFVVGLSSGLDAPDREFLRAAATGEGAGVRCGVRLSPETGAYADVGTSDRLFLAFGDLLDDGADVSVEGLCPGEPCERGTASFRAVPGLAGFVLRATTGRDGAAVVLRPPDGRPVALRQGGPASVSVGGATVTQRWVSKRAVEIRGTFDPGTDRWAGRWRYSFVAPRGVRADDRPLARISLRSAARPVLRGPAALLRGAPTDIVADLAPLPTPSRAALSATVRVAGRAPIVVPLTGDDGRSTGQVTLSEDVTATAGTVQVVARFADVGGIPVAAESTSARRPVRLPADQGYPTVEPDELGLRSLKGEGTRTGEITITASDDAAGCAAVGRPRAEVPDDAMASMSATLEGGAGAACRRLKPGERAVATVRVEVTEDGDGQLRATVPVVLTSAIHPGTRTVDVPVSLSLEHRENPVNVVLIALVLLLLGVVFPVTLLYAINWFLARLTPEHRLRTSHRRVVVRPGGGITGTDGAPLGIDYLDDFKRLSDEAAPGHRRLVVSPFVIRAIAARRPSDLLRGPFAVANASGGARAPLGGSLTDAPGRAREGEVLVPLTVAGTWLFLPEHIDHAASPDPDDYLAETPSDGVTAVTGVLVLIIAEAGEAAKGQPLLVEAERELTQMRWDEQPGGGGNDGSDNDGSDPDGSDPDGSDPDGSDPDGSDPDGSDPDGPPTSGGHTTGSDPLDKYTDY